jgi:hypothetical protein
VIKEIGVNMFIADIFENTAAFDGIPNPCERSSLGMKKQKII